MVKAHETGTICFFCPLANNREKEFRISSLHKWIELNKKSLEYCFCACQMKAYDNTFFAIEVFKMAKNDDFCDVHLDSCYRTALFLKC